MSGKSFIKEWTDTGRLIAGGGQIGRSNLCAIYENLDISHIKPDCLPGEDTVAGSVSDRKKAIFALAEKLWGVTPENWLKAEHFFLQEARKISGSIETGGKDSLNDVVSAEILIRIIAAAKLVYEDKQGREIADEVIQALDIVLSEVCAKGRARMIMVGDQSVYSMMKKGGLMIGTGGGKYLPYPEKALPELLFLLHRDNIRPEAYLE